jgi:hypothetical protein
MPVNAMIKLIVWAICGITASLICVAGAIFWQGRIQTRAVGASLVIVDRWRDTVRVCSVVDPAGVETTVTARRINCTVEADPYWSQGQQLRH